MARRNVSAGAPEELDGQLRFGVLNWTLLAAAVLSIVVGFVLLGGGSTVAAPLLLVAGYVVLMPLGIIL